MSQTKQTIESILPEVDFDIFKACGKDIISKLESQELSQEDQKLIKSVDFKLNLLSNLIKRTLDILFEGDNYKEIYEEVRDLKSDKIFERLAKESEENNLFAFNLIKSIAQAYLDEIDSLDIEIEPDQDFIEILNA